MKYVCERCHKEFHQKSNYVYHIGRKIPCKIINDNLIDHNDKNKNEDNKDASISNPNVTHNESKCNPNDKHSYECLICHKKYILRQGLYRHKRQKHPNYNEEIKNIKTQNNNDEINELKEKLNKTEEKLNKLLKSKKKQPQQQIQNNNLTINNYNIDFGFERYDFDMDKRSDILHRIDKNESIYAVTKLIYCNPELASNVATHLDNLATNSKQLSSMEKKSFAKICDTHKHLTDDLKQNKELLDKYNMLLFNNKDIIKMNITKNQNSDEQNEKQNDDKEIKYINV